MKPVMVHAQQGFPAPRCVPSGVVYLKLSYDYVVLCLWWFVHMHGNMVHC